MKLTKNESSWSYHKQVNTFITKQMRGWSSTIAVRQGAMRGIWDSERQPHSSGSLSEDSKKGRGLSRNELSSLTPKPDEELLWEGKRWKGQFSITHWKVFFKMQTVFVQRHTFHNQSHRRPCPLIYWCNCCWSAGWLQPPCTWSYQEHTFQSLWCLGLTGGTDGGDCPTTTKAHEEH